MNTSRIKHICFLSILIMMFTLGGCATTPKMSTMQKRHISSKVMEGSYENIYRATLTILQDQDYVIKNTDMDSGLIVATVDREVSGGRQFMEIMFVSMTKYAKNTQIEVSCMIDKLNDYSSEIRVNLQEIVYQADGTKRSLRQVTNDEIYYHLFREIITEVKRREAINPSAVRPKPTSEEKVSNIAGDHRRKKDIKEVSFKELQEGSENKVASLLSEARSLYKKKEYTQAESKYRDVLKLDKDNKTALRYLVIIPKKIKEAGLEKNQ